MIYFELNFKKYIIVHIPKTAGTSIKKAIFENFKSYINLTESKKNNVCKYTNGIDAHAPISFIKTRLIDHSIYFIVIVRNPWARMFSLFQHTLLRKNTNKHNLFLSNLHLDVRSKYSKNFENIALNEINKIGIKNIKECFEFWLFFIGRNKDIIPLGNPNFNILPQEWWFLEDKLLTKNIIFFQYEKLLDLESYLGVSIKKENKSSFDSNSFYSKVYNSRTKDYVSNLDSWVIKKFNYIF